jgi:hypothetical protein
MQHQFEAEHPQRREIGIGIMDLCRDDVAIEGERSVDIADDEIYSELRQERAIVRGGDPGLTGSLSYRDLLPTASA